MSKNPEDWQEKRKNYLAVAIICFLVGTYFFTRVLSGSYVIEPSDLEVYENLITAETPEFKTTKGKHSRRWIEFKCINNKSTFEIASFDYSCININEVINEIKTGDTISIAILKNDIEDFDAETSCEIHSLIKNDKEYLNIQCRNKLDNKDSEKGFLVLFAITIMTGIVFLFPQKPKLFDQFDPKGYSRIVKLHDKLYSEKLKSNLRLDIDFVPHIGIGNSKDKFSCKKMVDQWNEKEFSISGKITHLTVVNYENDTIK